ncbi:MAG: synthase [Sulfobacillus benefaciens]|uniref:Synthase n=1 Tax=Sulfobacillus benefaciens TaxID=453960 RepID=A0A2T2XJB7_9FIRM|nr:MAG: synthase [Sulfobacillus benefaciens]
MRITTLGSYPKIPADHGPSVRTAIQRFERGSIGPTQLEQTIRDRTRHVIQVAKAHRLDLTSDGMIRWNDMFDGVVRDIDNVQSAGLLRFLDNNFYYRHPLVRGRLSFQGGVVRWWMTQAVGVSTIPVKAVLPGPFTFLQLSQDDSYHNRQALLDDVVEVLRLEANSLLDTGIQEIQWDEPALAYYPGWDIGEVSETLAHLTKDLSVDQSLALYWGPGVHRWIEPLAIAGFSRLYLDAVSDPEVVPRLSSEQLPVEVGVGLIDARQVKKESVPELVKKLEPILRVQGESRVWLHPNGGLELLPPDHAEGKVHVLSQVRDAVAIAPRNGGRG